MSQLRQKLETDPTQPQYLLTESGVGYRLKSNAGVFKISRPIGSVSNPVNYLPNGQNVRSFTRLYSLRLNYFYKILYSHPRRLSENKAIERAVPLGFREFQIFQSPNN